MTTDDARPNRRTMLLGAMGLAVPVLTGCRSDGAGPAPSGGTTPSGTSGLGGGDSHPGLTASGGSASSRSVSRSKATSTQDPAQLTAALTALDRSRTGSLTAAVHDHRSGHLITYEAARRVECASIIKVTILAMLCDRAQREKRSLTASEKSRADLMIRHSDNDAAQSIWLDLDGASTAGGFVRGLGMNETTPRSAWGLIRSSAKDQMILLDAITHDTKRFDASNRSYMLGLLRGVESEQRWGVGVISGAAVKNGWLPYDGQWLVNSIGAVQNADRDYTVVILQIAPSMESGKATIDEAARTIERHVAAW